MSVTAAELILYGAASWPNDDVSTTGGAIDLTNRPSFTQFTAAAKAAVISDGADVRTLTIWGRLATGVITSELLTLNGAVEVLSANTYERILRAVMTVTSGTRTVSIKQGTGGTVRGTIPINEKESRINFYNSASGSGILIRYEKLFFYNSDATLALLGAQLTLTADPAARIRIAGATAQGDSGSVANRLTLPGGLTFVDDGVAQNIAGTDLAPVTGIGMWVEQNLPANDPANRTTATYQLSGSTV